MSMKLKPFTSPAAKGTSADEFLLSLHGTQLHFNNLVKKIAEKLS